MVYILSAFDQGRSIFGLVLIRKNSLIKERNFESEVDIRRKKQMTTKKLYLTVGAGLAFCAATAQAGFDGTLKFTGNGGGNANGGGVFNVTTTANSGTPILGNFGTFCIEKNEFIAVPSSVYSYKINNGAVAGGVAGQTLPNDTYTGLPIDRISIGTAFLYSQFRAAAVGYTSDLAKSQLQVAIWYLENEITTTSLGGIDGSSFINAATTKATSLGMAARDNSNGAFGVVVLNIFTDNNHNGIWDSGDTAQQDQLAIVPEPTTMIAGALLVLPFGASALRGLRRKP